MIDLWYHLPDLILFACAVGIGIFIHRIRSKWTKYQNRRPQDEIIDVN